MVRIKKGVIDAWKRGKLGQRQMGLEEFKVKEEIQRLTYQQDWKNYNLAKTREKTISLSLLNELLDIYGEPKKTLAKGRPTLSLKDKVLSMFTYCYNGFSSRRAIPDIRLIQKLELIEKVPHFNTVLNMFKDKGITHHLIELLEISSLPLRMFEEHLAIDATGFSTSTFERWLDIRTQKPVKKRNWMKVHIISGARTNIVCSIGITEGHGADSPQLSPLVDKAVRHFEPKEISADKAYLSRANMEKIASVGAIPYIPFKKNTSAKRKGSPIWRAMFDYFYQTQEEFMKHYHLRSNVETAFSMIKRTLGHRLRMKTHSSQVNEILMKCICHNLAVLVQESFELGLEIDFNKCAEIYTAQKDKD
jgi:transposase